METGQFCRLCLFSGRGLQDIFDSFIEDGTAVIDLIQDLLHLTVIQLKVFPWMICQSCMYHLQEFHCFKARCMRSKLVADGMFSVSMDGAITAQSLGFKRKERDQRPIEQFALNTLEMTIKGRPADKDSSAIRPPTSSMDCNKTEESVDESVVKFCWCPECGCEFLNPQELNAHTQWCRGRVKLGWHWINGDIRGEDRINFQPMETFDQPLFNPNICCSRCRKVFKTKKHLVQHINKHDFKCKPHSSLAEDINNSGDLNEKPAVPSFHRMQHGELCAVNKENEIKNKVASKCSASSPNMIHTKKRDGKQKIDGGLNAVNLRCPENKTMANIRDVDSNPGNMFHHESVLRNANLSSFNKCGKVLESKDFLTPITLKDTSYLADSGNESFSSGTKKVERNSPKLLTIAMNKNCREKSLMTAEGGNGTSKFAVMKLLQFSKDTKITLEFKTYLCNYCEKPYTTKPDLRNHIVKCHLCMNPQKCNVCHRLFTNCEELEQHSLMHPEGKKFYCTVCEECFPYRVVLKKHMTEIHGVKNSFICNLCFNGFTSMNDIGLHHSLVHTKADKAYSCSKCKKSYTMKKHFITHLRVCQLKAILFPCKLCGKHFTTKTNLHNHSIFHSGEKKFACPMCPKHFWMSSDRNIHIRSVHLNIRPYECGICGKRFVVKATLQKHYTTHSDEKPFKCTKCSKYFKVKSTLNRHMKCIHMVS
ncbi:zinc finger protein 59-like isoform X3 [Ischnura elegans]|uniref:zinc finger protein 59-like isoform X3 n=1 Tax=Ischnura elegans TaxID=197161 RepID=UPI001ED899B8|nr:zinc finger protein 59-like isoform X3 [Ischnura elegans]